MVYFDREEIKDDLNIQGTNFDSTIDDNWGPKADDEVNDRIYSVAAKVRRVTYLPTIPLQGNDITQSAINAANHFVKQKYYLRTRNPEMANIEEKAADKEIEKFISKLKTDKVFYARIVR